MLAEYVRELLRKEDKSDAELREYCRDSLTDFLSGETDAFVESLFDAIASGEYERAVGTPTQRPAGRGSSCESWRLSEGDASQPDAGEEPPKDPPQKDGAEL